MNDSIFDIIDDVLQKYAGEVSEDLIAKFSSDVTLAIMKSYDIGYNKGRED